MGQRAAEIRALGADLLAVAVTATFSQQAFAESLGVDFPLLSDWDREVCAAYGVQYDVWKGHHGLAKRSVFVVDRGPGGALPLGHRRRPGPARPRRGGAGTAGLRGSVLT